VAQLRRRTRSQVQSLDTLVEPRLGPLPNGPAAAAVLAAGIGCFALGLLTVLSTAFTPLANVLQFYQPTGPLTGVSTLAVVIWLIAWLVYHRLWRQKQMRFTTVLVVTLVLIILGVIGTFPPFYNLF
jgi:hypothetical protein